MNPLQNFYLDIPLSVQCPVAGVVFIDKDGDGKSDKQKDETVEGARIIYGKTEVTTGKGGRYILRNTSIRQERVARTVVLGQGE